MAYPKNACARSAAHVLARPIFNALICGTALMAPMFAAAAEAGDGMCQGATAIEQPFARVSMPHAPSMLMAQADTKQDEQQTASPESEDEDHLTNELAAMLQACSYDGKPIALASGSLTADKDKTGEEAVGDIMRYTGLPQNFKVMEGNVPNAAAMIVLDEKGLPQRVIAYNAAFMKRVRSATQGNDWAPVSVIAHEIGHHLSGHTLMPGGSQPPVELEADKFSGFVLFKMGAPLDGAEKAIATLVPERDGPTHPGRSKRLAAVKAGWTESCDQQPGGCDEDGPMVAAAPVPTDGDGTRDQPARSTSHGAVADARPAGSALPDLDIPGPADIRMPGEHPSSRGDVPIPPESLDKVPVLGADATPSKFDRFVYDEVGVFHPRIKAELAQRSFAFAARHNVEIVTIIAKDLQGRSADQYALDVMRQLRVGKMEVGNGAVLVVAPEPRQAGVALGPGLATEYESLEDLRGYLDGFLEVVTGGGRAQVASDLIVDASSRIMRDTQSSEWIVRYQSLGEMLAAAEAYRAELDKTGARYDPAKDPTWGKLARVRATLVSTTPARDGGGVDINEAKERNFGPAVQVRTADGKDAVVYVNPGVTALMPSRLEEGRQYSFVVRDTFLTGDAPQLDLVSFDLLR